MARVCLMTSGQPTSNPRLVKEADALSEIGHNVQVFCAESGVWPLELDRDLLASRKWQCTYVDGSYASWRNKKTRIRYGVVRRLHTHLGRVFNEAMTLSRVSPELGKAGKSVCADLYIAHNLAALPPAVAAAKKWSAKVGFDAEDFHSGQEESVQTRNLVESIERKYLPQCDYLTAGSPQIAEAYAAKYRVPSPIPILNVFPLSQRPSEFRLSVPRAPLTLYWFSQTIGAKRGLEDVVRAIGSLPECNIELHLRGDWQTDYKAQLLALADACGVSRNRIKDHIPAPADEMARLASMYDVGLALEQFIDLNREICLTNKIFTYLLAGNAVVATATKAQKALMETLDETGFCYAPGEVQVLAAQLKRWHDDRKTLERARRAAWECGTKRYNWDVEKHKFLAIVENILKNPVS